MDKIYNFDELIAELRSYQRIIVVGAPGVGKSYLAKKIAQYLGISLYNLDKIFWQKNWQQLDAEEFNRRVEDVLNKESFIIEGTYISSFKHRAENADIVVLVEMGFFRRFYRIISRSFNNIGRVRDDMADGCIETISWSYFKFLKWALKFREAKCRIIKEAREVGVRLLIYKNE